MFVNKDESIWAMGQGMSGEDDKGWLRKIDKPEDCSDYKKLINFNTYRLVLTNSGKLFVNGQGYDDILSLQNPDESALTEFKEINIGEFFSENAPADKIIDIAVGKENPDSGVLHKGNKNMILIATESGKVYAKG